MNINLIWGPILVNTFHLFFFFLIIRPHCQHSKIATRLYFIISAVCLSYFVVGLRFLLLISINLEFSFDNTFLIYLLSNLGLILQSFLILVLGIFTFFIIYFNAKPKILNKIGFFLLAILTIIIVLLLTLGFLFIMLYQQPEISIKGKNYKTQLNYTGNNIEKFFLLTNSIISLISILLTLFMKQININRNQFHKGKRKYIINQTYLFYSSTNLLNILILFIPFFVHNEILLSIISMVHCLIPTILILEFIFIEEWYRIDRQKYDIEKIMNISKLRESFKDYFTENNGNNQLELIKDWEKIFDTRKSHVYLFNWTRYSRESALYVIEKQLSYEVDKFLFDDSFMKYYSERLINGKNNA